MALVLVIPLHSVNRLFQFSTLLALLIKIKDFVFRRFAQSLGCDFSSLKECAKKKTFQEIVDAQTEIYPLEGALSFGPVLDGYFLPGTEMNIKQILLSPAKRREILALTRKKNEGCIVSFQSETDQPGWLRPFLLAQSCANLSDFLIYSLVTD